MDWEEDPDKSGNYLAMKVEVMLKNLPPNMGLIMTDADSNIISFGGMAFQILDQNCIPPELICELKNAVEHGSAVFKTSKQESVMIDATKVDYDGEDRYMFWLRDWTENAKSEIKLHCFIEILDNINEGVIATDENGCIFIYNKQLSEFEDLPQKSVIGKKLKDVYSWSVENSEHMHVIKTKTPMTEGNYRTITHMGRINHLVASTYPIVRKGDAIAAYSISRNVTKIREIYNRTVDLLPVSTGTQRELKNGTRFTFEDIICENPKMKSLISDAQKAALSPSPVLVYGETGTGKELFVQGIHNSGSSRGEPFVALNCAALPETLLESLLFGTVKGAFTGSESTVGFFEQAKEGTLYLDEINSMPLNLQAKLLRVIQEKKIRRIGGSKEVTMKCKIVSSVNKDPFLCIKEGQLRQDLYYRLGVITLPIPPLRDRREDIPKLIDFFLNKYSQLYRNKKVVAEQSLIDSLMLYDWPGNVRELEHTIERAISLIKEDEKLAVNNLPAYLRNKLFTQKFMLGNEEYEKGSLNEILSEVEKKVIKEALRSNSMNVTQAAKSIGIGRQNLQYRMNKLGIKKKETEHL